MAYSTQVKDLLNRRVLNPLNLNLDSLTAERAAEADLQQLIEEGHFERPVFPVPKPIEEADPAPILQQVDRLRDDLDKLESPDRNDVGYTYDNDYYTSPDTEVLYGVLAMTDPGLFMEVGSGNSTRIARQAIADQGLRTKICSVDPLPRVEIDDLADEVVRQRVEETDPRLFERLQAGDVLFIDSSHALGMDNDVNYLYLRVLPSLPAGVIVHVHDIFIPFDYPLRMANWAWNEQYLVQAVLSLSDTFEVLWAGRYFQHAKDVRRHFPHWRPGRDAQSLWMRKLK